MLAATAIIIVFTSDDIISRLLKRRLYQSSVNPVKTELLLDWLNENTISTKIGAYKNSITSTRYNFPSFFNFHPPLHKHLIVRVELVHNGHYHEYYHHENKRDRRSEMRIVGVSEKLHFNKVADEKIRASSEHS